MTSFYRADIDGLRSIAVLGVIIYHAELYVNDGQILSGGFLGVDVFFVISGFLITRILCNEIASDDFSFAGFYERRARRILPVLLLVATLTVPLAWWLMLPPALIDYAGSLVTSLFFSSNLWFWSADSYWGQASALKPLLHTWSLAIEEQFYLIAPWLIIIFSRKRTMLVIAFVLIFIASLVFAELTSRHAPESAFFLLPSRAWELLAGSLVSFYLASKHDSQMPRLNSQFLAVLGLGLIVGPMIFFDSSIRHPSIYTLMPVSGAVLLIACSQQTLVGRFLSIKPLVWIGLISYSLYLWHFPLFAFFKVANIQLSILHKLALLGTSVLLATLSYRYFEKPFRDKAWLSSRRFLLILIAWLALLVGAASYAYIKEGLPKRFVDFNGALAYLSYDYETAFLSHTCFLHPEDLNGDVSFSSCKYNDIAAAQDSNEKPTLVLWGDSYAAHLIPGIRREYEASYNLIIRTISGCGVFLGEKNIHRPGCLEHNDNVFELVSAIKPEKLVIAGYWTPEYVDLLEVTLRALTDAGVENTVVIGPMPQWAPSLPVALQQYGMSNHGAREFPTYLRNHAHKKVQTIDKSMEAMVLKNKADYYSPRSVLCNESLGCMTNTNGLLLQWDYGHMTAEGSKLIIKYFAKTHP